MKTRTILLEILGLAVVGVIVAAVWVGYKKYPHAKNSQYIVGARTDAQNKKDIPSEIPSGLLIDSQAIITENYNIDYPETKQYTLSLNSKLSQNDLYAEYLAYLTKNDYKIVNSTSQNAPVFAIYATKGSEIVNIGISKNPDGKTSDVLLSYSLAKK